MDDQNKQNVNNIEPAVTQEPTQPVEETPADQPSSSEPVISTLSEVEGEKSENTEEISHDVRDDGVNLDDSPEAEANAGASEEAIEENTGSGVQNTEEQESAEQAAISETSDSNKEGGTVISNDSEKSLSLSEEPASAGDPSATLQDDNQKAPGRWYVVHTYSGHENKVAAQLKQRIESEHLENKIFDILVPTQDKIEIRGGKKNTVKEKIFPGYILVKMDLDDISWLAVRTTQGVTSFVGIGNRPTPIPEHEVKSIVQFMSQGASPTFKDVFMVNDTVKIIDGPFAEFIGKVDSVDKEKGKVRVLVSIFGRETPVELDFLQVTKL